MDNLEGHIKKSLENYEASYNPTDWADMEKRLDRHSALKPTSGAGKILGIAAGVLAVAGLVYFISTTTSENKQSEKTTAPNTIAETNGIKENPSVNVGVHNQELQAIGTQETAESSVNGTSQKTNSSTNNIEEQKSVIAENTSHQNTNTENNEVKTEPSPVPASSSLNATFHLNQTLVCAGTAVQFNAENAVPCTYRWEFGDGRTSGEKSPSHVYKNPGTYFVKLKLTETKQKISDEKQITLTVNPVPAAEIDFSASENNPSEINFEAKGNGISEASWNFDDKQTSSEKNPVHNYMKKGNYQVTLTAKNSYGCTMSDKRMVNIENLFPLAPNSFSPNGDNLNDTWMPVSFKNGDYNFTLSVFDKNGNMIFKTTDKDKAWDGDNARTGDVFIWKATVKNKNGKEINYNGSIQIVE